MRSLRPLSTRFSPTLAPLAIEFRPSRLLRGVFLLAALLAALALWHTALAWPLRLLLALVASFYLLSLSARQTGWPRPAAWRALRWNAGWLLQDGRGRWHPVGVEESVIWPGVVALQLRAPGGRRLRLLLADDALGAEAARRLRLYLRCIAGPG